jgi:hypothetical protein
MFVNPMMQITAHLLHRNLAHSSRLFSFVNYFLPRALKPLQPKGTLVKRDIMNPYFDANLVLISSLTYLGILLTFGAMFPPLGVAVFMTILVSVMFEKLKVGRLICLAIDSGALEYLDIIEVECQGVGSVRKLRSAMWMIVSVCGIFYAQFLFDTLGDAVGYNQALWVWVITPLAPLLCYTMNQIYQDVFARSSSSVPQEAGRHRDTEMKVLEMMKNTNSTNNADFQENTAESTVEIHIIDSTVDVQNALHDDNNNNNHL